VRNYRMYYMSPECILGFFVGKGKFHCWGTIDGPPEDAKVIDVFFIHEKRIVGMTLEHPSFEELPDLATIPVHEVQIVGADTALKELVKTHWFEMFVKDALEEGE